MGNTYDQHIKNFTGSGSGQFTSLNSSYALIRRNIENGNVNEAQDSLDKMSERDAEWNFFMGMISTQKGWHDNAYTYLHNACTQEPLNKEYKEAFNKLISTKNLYTATYYNRGAGNDGTRHKSLEPCGQDGICEWCGCCECCCVGAECLGGC